MVVTAASNRAGAVVLEKTTEPGLLEITTTPGARLSPKTVRRYTESGVQRLVLYRRAQAADELLRFLEKTAATLVQTSQAS
jgi:hypothetical protein